jgi:hypothetical protein
LGRVQGATDNFDKVLTFEKMAHAGDRQVRPDLESTLKASYIKDMEEVWLIWNLI